MSDEFAQERAASVKHTLNQVASTEKALKKIHTAVLAAALDNAKKQKATLAAAKERLQALREEAPMTMRKHIQSMTNEVISLEEGLRAGLVTKEDMMLHSTTKAINAANRLKLTAEKTLEAIGFGSGADHSGEWEQVINRNVKYKAKLPDTSKSGFGVTRVPVSLTFVRNMRNKHSSVGFLNLEMLDTLGFKADMIGGYAVVYNQLVLGVDPRDAYDIVEETDPETGKKTKTMKPKFVKERATKFSNDKGAIVDTKRPKNALDLAKTIRQLLEKKTGEQWEFVSEKPYGYQGTSYFWLMSARDLNRFAKAFPGKHVAMDNWGFAF